MSKLFKLKLIQPAFDELYKEFEKRFDTQIVPELKKRKTTGILNRGKNNIFIDNIFEQLDVGIQDEGENTFASGNKFKDQEFSSKREKWSTENLPKKYPMGCNTDLVKDVVQDLSNEYHQKIQAGKSNKAWKQLTFNLIKSGQEELKQREQKRKTSWFSMDNPIVYIIVVVILATLAYLTYKFKLPLIFGFN